MKYNIGDYVITNDRLHIGKIYNINEFREPSMMYAIDFPNADDFIFMGENDFTSSPKIIDLIKKEDVVIDYKGNIYQVVKVWKDYVFTDKKNECGQVITLVDYQIKKVITKENLALLDTMRINLKDEIKEIIQLIGNCCYHGEISEDKCKKYCNCITNLQKEKEDYKSRIDKAVDEIQQLIDGVNNKTIIGLNNFIPKLEEIQDKLAGGDEDVKD